MSVEVCQTCGGPNVVWFAPNEIWNRAGASGILCPTCFIQLAESKGIKTTGWRLEPEELRDGLTRQLAESDAVLKELHYSLVRRSGASSWEEFTSTWDPTEETAIDCITRLAKQFAEKNAETSRIAASLQFVEQRRAEDIQERMKLIQERDSLKTQLAEAISRGNCDVCVGTGNPNTGLDCACGGSGRSQDAARYFRQQFLEATERAEKAERRLAVKRLQLELDAARKDTERPA